MNANFAITVQQMLCLWMHIKRCDLACGDDPYAGFPDGPLRKEDALYPFIFTN